MRFFRKKLILMYAFLLVVIICLLIILMQISTNSIMEDIEKAFYCTDAYIDEVLYNSNSSYYNNHPFINYIVYKEGTYHHNINAYFNTTAHAIVISNNRNVKTQLKLQRVFTWHNFNKGILWIKYSVEVLNPDGNSITGSWDVLSKLSIVKENGKWNVTSISEKP